MMSTSRLKGLYKQEQNHRKFACVMNDVAKTQQELYEGYLDKEKQEAAQRCQKSIVVTRRNVVRQRVLQKCMKTTREKARKQIKISMNDKYGRYNGVCVEQIADNIDTYLEQDHPRIRKQNKLNKLFEKGYERGAILDYDSAKRKVHKYFEKPLVELYTGRDRSEEHQREDRATFLPPLASGFYTGSFADWSKPYADVADIEHDISDTDPMFVRRKVSKFLEEDVPDNFSVQSEARVKETRFPSKSKQRPITLPPIKVGTDNSTADGKPKPDSISDLITRLNRAKDKREKETKLRKEKRAKRLQAERVHARWHEVDNDSEFGEVAGNYLIVEGYSRNRISRNQSDRREIVNS